MLKTKDIPRGGHYRHSWKVGFLPHRMHYRPSTSTEAAGLQVDCLGTGECKMLDILTKNWVEHKKPDHVEVTAQCAYWCQLGAMECFSIVQRNEICLVLAEKKAFTWRSPAHIRGITLSSEHVYISTIQTIEKYTLDGNFVQNWLVVPYVRECTYLSRNLVFDRDELFIVNPLALLIHVYSPKGILLREWRHRGKCEPWDLAISPCGQILYVTDKTQILVLNRSGQPCFSISTSSKLVQDLGNIIPLRDSLYVTDWESWCIHEFALTFEYAGWKSEQEKRLKTERNLGPLKRWWQALKKKK